VTTSKVRRRSRTDTIYRKCECGETAHDYDYDIARKAFVWRCRNCRKLALDRHGQVREYRPEVK
jgi:hypothetical protein